MGSPVLGYRRQGVVSSCDPRSGRFGPSAGIRHFWYGSSKNRLPLDQLLLKFPELDGRFVRPAADASSRRVEDCYFRHEPRRDPDVDVELASCKLLQQLSGVMDIRLCDVRRDVCQACRESPDPSLTSINPIVASLLFRLADRVVETRRRRRL